MQNIAALYVQTGGSYYGLDGVDTWDEERDARAYSGPHPVVAHPPCQRWGKMFFGSPSAVARGTPKKKLGDDGGCFAAAVDAVRRYGGVLEHPWGSKAWDYFNINKPPREGGWIAAGIPGAENGWTCCVEQGRYGHYAPKPTLLYAVHTDLPVLDWGKYIVKDEDFPAWALEKYGPKKCRRIGLLSFKGGGTDSTPRIATPPDFRNILIAMARSVGN